MGFFRLTKITSHSANSSQFNELPHSVSQAWVRLVRMETLQVPPAPSRVPKSSAVCFHQRHFHPTAVLQVSLRLEIPAPAPAAPAYFGKSLGQRR